MSDETTPHLTELLDLTAVVEAATLAAVGQAMKRNGDDPAGAREALADMRVIDRQELRTDVLAVVYAGARAVAEQAYAAGWRDGQTEDHDLEADSVGNPFAEGRVIL